MKSDIQSVLFNRDEFNIKEARKWLKKNGLNDKFKEPHITTNYIRWRQLQPEIFKYFRIKKTTDPGIMLVIGFY